MSDNSNSCHSNNSNNSNNSYHRKIKSFVKRNRTLTQTKQDLLDRAYPIWGLDNSTTWDFQNIFNNSNNIILEIGFGNGNTLIADAENNLNNNYIGIEVFRSGVLNILDNLENNSINNLRVYEGDAKEILLNNISNNSLYGIHIYFPDPWPKKRHHKRRLINNEFLDLLATKIKLDGYVHFATDWANYAEQMQEVLENNSKFIKSNLDGYSNIISNINRNLTRFEAKGISKGHQIFDFIYIKVSN